MPFHFQVPSLTEAKQFDISEGETIIFVGANGGGKTRLTVHIETSLGFDAHRISAHRALNLNADVPKISERQALAGLRTGITDMRYAEQLPFRENNRWGQKGATQLLNDFEYLLQALFAEQANTALKAYQDGKPGAERSEGDFQLTKLDRLSEIWSRLLPHRNLHISGDDILVSIPGSDAKYKAADMSDGERAIFYMIGQALVAKQNSVLIVDEPELHVHRSIMSKLWDEIEAERPDCALVFITHDLDFAATRFAKKYVIRDFTPQPTWTIERLPEDSGFPEELVTLILGSRRPILFVEGTENSFDYAVYRACYPDWTVIPKSSCTEVIHSVVTMRANASLTRVTCSGIVDGDDYDDGDSGYLDSLGIKVLPVSEVENLFALSGVAKAIACSEGFSGAELDAKIEELKANIFQQITPEESLEKVVVRHARRRIDRMLKKLDLSEAKTGTELKNEYNARTAGLNIDELIEIRRKEVKDAISNDDLDALLRYYDNKKGIVAALASTLKGTRREMFEAWLMRNLNSKDSDTLTLALKEYLPELQPL